MSKTSNFRIRYNLYQEARGGYPYEVEERELGIFGFHWHETGTYKTMEEAMERVRYLQKLAEARHKPYVYTYFD